LFQEVDAVQFRRSYRGLHLREAAPEEIGELVQNLEAVPSSPRRFIVFGETLRMGWVVCGAFGTAENVLDYYEMPELLARSGGLGVGVRPEPD